MAVALSTLMRRHFEVCRRRNDTLVKRKGTKCNRSLFSSKSEEFKKGLFATGSLSYLLSRGYICPKDVEQLDSCNRPITNRWNSIKSLRYVEWVVPTGERAQNRFTDRRLKEDSRVCVSLGRVNAPCC